jgi:hypothetical protein
MKNIQWYITFQQEIVNHVLKCLDILNRSINKKNIFVISFFENKNMQTFFQNKYPNLVFLEGNSLCSKITNFKDFDTSFFFKLDDSGNVYNAFVPDKYFPDLIKMYLDSFNKLD